MSKNPQFVRKQLNDRLRHVYIFERRFIEGQDLSEIAEFYDISIAEAGKIITRVKTRYEQTYNTVREKVFGLPPIEITLLMMQNPDILRATESWIKLHRAMLSYFLDRAYPGLDI